MWRPVLPAPVLLAYTLTTRVVSCKRSEGDREYGPYQVLLADTVLFPEGGGQVSITVLVLYLLAIP